jgi:hypothetical protein
MGRIDIRFRSKKDAGRQSELTPAKSDKQIETHTLEFYRKEQLSENLCRIAQHARVDHVTLASWRFAHRPGFLKHFVIPKGELKCH